MFGLLKLAVYALAGYALYEFFIGLTSGDGGERGMRWQEGQSQQRRPRQPDVSNRGEPMMQTTVEPDGGRSSHSVGRGVVAR